VAVGVDDASTQGHRVEMERAWGGEGRWRREGRGRVGSDGEGGMG
jgi:hypothetical protein